MDLTKTQIHDILKKYLQSLIKEYDQPAKYDKFVNEGDYHQYGTDEEAVMGTLTVLDWKKAEYNAKVHSGDYSDVEPEADRLLGKEGINDADIDKASPVYGKLCSGLLRAEIKGFEYQQQKLSGAYSDDLEGVLEDSLPGSPALPQDSKQEPVKPVKTISQIMADFFEKGDTEKKWTEKTRGEVESSMNLLVEFFGDVPIDSITRAMMLEYQKALWKLPPNMTKGKKYKNKTVHEVLDMKPEETIKAHTYNKYTGRAITLFDFAVNNEDMDKNPAIGLKMKINKRNSDAREIFDKADLENLFNSDQYLSDTFKKPYQFWTPIIALFPNQSIDILKSWDNMGPFL